MTPPPHPQTPLTDVAALGRNRARARTEALVLHQFAADDVQERLAMVNRSFTAPAIVAPYPHIWKDRLPGAVVVQDADVLDLAPGAHDLVIHALALHWANDPVGQIIQCRRALRPDGLFLGTLAGGRTLASLRAALAEAEVALTGGLSPRVLPMADIRDAGGLLQRAGLALAVADSFVQRVSYADAFALMHDLRAMGEANALAARHRRIPPRAMFAKAAALYAKAEPGPDGRVLASFEVIVLTGWAPHDAQPRPLRPGSAVARLADALGVIETPLPQAGEPRTD
jgi:SAM-dependent methyltransferase